MTTPAPKETTDFIPHGHRCDADDGRGSDFGQCSETATHFVVHRGVNRYVCEFHYRHYAPISSPAVR